MLLNRQVVIRVFAKRNCTTMASGASAATVLPFDQIPAPRSLPLLGTRLAFLAAGGAPKLHEYIDRRHKTLGPIFREKIGGPVELVFISDPNDIRTMFSREDKFPMHLCPEAWSVYNQRYQCKRGLFFMNGEEWWNFRKIANKVLLNRHDSKWIDDACDLVSNKVLHDLESQLTSDGELPDPEGFLYKWSLDTIVAVMLGARTYPRESANLESKVARLASIVHLIFQTSSKLYSIPADWAATLQIPAWRRFKESVDNALEKGDELAKQLISKRPSGEIQDGMLHKFLEKQVEVEDLSRIATDLILAAGDTTAYTMEWILYQLAKHQDVQEQLRNDNGLARNIMRETLRLFPVAPFLTRVSTQEITLAGYAIPPGKVVIMSIYTSGRDERVYKNAEEFDPMRWDRSHKDYLKTMQVASLPFAMGVRSCIGRLIAERQLQETMRNIVNNFQIDLCDNEEIGMIVKMVGVPSKPVRLKFTKIVRPSFKVRSELSSLNLQD